MNITALVVLLLGAAALFMFAGLSALEVPGNMPRPRSQTVRAYLSFTLAALSLVGMIVSLVVASASA